MAVKAYLVQRMRSTVDRIVGPSTSSIRCLARSVPSMFQYLRSEALTWNGRGRCGCAGASFHSAFTPNLAVDATALLRR